LGSKPTSSSHSVYNAVYVLRNPASDAQRNAEPRENRPACQPDLTDSLAQDHKGGAGREREGTLGRAFFETKKQTEQTWNWFNLLHVSICWAWVLCVLYVLYIHMYLSTCCDCCTCSGGYRARARIDGTLPSITEQITERLVFCGAGL
jgi:hypothetical protein